MTDELTDRVRQLEAERLRPQTRTHWPGCAAAHPECARVDERRRIARRAREWYTALAGRADEPTARQVLLDFAAEIDSSAGG